jgi:hydroxylaminobenzene mutase
MYQLNSTMPLAAGTDHGSNFQEAVIKIVAYSSAPTGIICFVPAFWGLRNAKQNGDQSALY